MQQNRESSSMDRRKADLSEPGLTDLKDSSTPAQDADVVLQLFYPFREKLTSYRGYPILGDNGFKNIFRSIITTKNRYGIANQVIGCAFYGSVGWFKELDKAEHIPDPSVYFYEKDNIPNNRKKPKIIEQKDLEVKDEEKQQITFSF